jgi:prepilin-type N-terminal cleavage/methylation domain-containing protein
MTQRTTTASGFTLLELTIVLVVVGLVITGLLVPLPGMIEQRRITDTQNRLEQIKEALLGFAAANGRLPCPASASSNGSESFAAGGNAANGLCSNFYDGFVPAATLGIAPTDDQGFAVDSWGLPQNRIRYAVADLPGGTTHALTAISGMKTLQMVNITGSSKLLLVCNSGIGLAKAGPNCGTATKLTDSAPVVIYSVGANGPTGGTSTDENENPNPQGGIADQFFVSHVKTPSPAPGGEFDDIVTWLSLNVLFSRMITAGQLP